MAKLELKDCYREKLLKIEQNYYKKHLNRRMGEKELDKLFGKRHDKEMQTSKNQYVTNKLCH